MILYERNCVEFNKIINKLELTNEENSLVYAIIDMTDEIPTSNLVRKGVINYERDEIDEFYILITTGDFSYGYKMLGRIYINIQPYYFWSKTINTAEEVSDLYEYVK